LILQHATFHATALQAWTLKRFVFLDSGTQHLLPHLFLNQLSKWFLYTAGALKCEGDNIQLKATSLTSYGFFRYNFLALLLVKFVCSFDELCSKKNSAHFFPFE
jgi:hypothetical protein